MTTKNETKDELVPAEDGAAPAHEPAAPSYVTKEEAQALADVAARRAADQAYDRASKHFQSVTDKRVAALEAQVSASAAKAELAERKRQDIEIAQLPEEERSAAYAKAAYERVRNLEEKPAPAAPATAARQPAAEEPDVVSQVRQQALQLANELGANYYDMRLWEGMGEGMSVEQNLNVFRANAQKYGAGTKPASPEKPPTKPAAERKPEPVPTRTETASPSRQMTDEEITEWVTRTGGFDVKANTAYREMQNRWHSE